MLRLQVAETDAVEDTTEPDDTLTTRNDGAVGYWYESLLLCPSMEMTVTRTSSIATTATTMTTIL